MGEAFECMTGEDRRESARAGAIPSGTVTFLFTDIEGSTRRWDTDSAAMTPALARHDALTRTAIEGCGGHIFKTVGNGFLCAFSAARDALDASIDLARSLAAADFSAVDGLQIRIALHTGLAEERDDDYFGPTLNRAARLLSTAHGGQIIVSGATHAALSISPQSSAVFKDLGVYRLKDLTRPERVFQLVAPDLRADFPPLRSLTALPNNLPSYLTSFVGREREVKDFAASIDANRLVTIVGLGGIGKTRTSLQVAANLLDGSGDGVWFVELAPVSSGDYISRAVAAAFGLNLPAGGDPAEHLGNLAGYLCAAADFSNACEAAREAVDELGRREPDAPYVVGALEHLALGLALQGRSTARPCSRPIATLRCDGTAPYGLTRKRPHTGAYGLC